MMEDVAEGMPGRRETYPTLLARNGASDRFEEEVNEVCGRLLTLDPRCHVPPFRTTSAKIVCS
jgi:hypothetical protein